MAQTYDPYAHSVVGIGGELYEMVLHVGTRVWIAATYADEIPGAVQVGDGLTNGYDEHGGRVLSVPADACAYWTQEEAATIRACQEADADLLGYARG